MGNEIADVVKKESARQTVILVFTLVGIVATAAVLNSHDEWRTIKMATALGAKRICQHEADRWQTWADHAATRYNREKA